MMQRSERHAAHSALAVCLVLAMSSITEAQRGPAPEPRASIDGSDLSITIVPPGQEPTMPVSKISDNGVVVGAAPPTGYVLRWQPGATAPENLGGAPAFTLDQPAPLISGNGAIVAANRLLPGADGKAAKRAGHVGGGDRLEHARAADAVPVAPGGHVQKRRLGRWLGLEPFGRSVRPALGVDDGTGADGVAGRAADLRRRSVGGVRGWPRRRRPSVRFPEPADLHRRFYATRWVEGTIRLMTDRTGAQLGQAYACSRDGSVVVGGGQGGDPDPGHPSFGQAWYWTEDTGGVYLGSHPDAAPGTAYYATDVRQMARRSSARTTWRPRMARSAIAAFSGPRRAAWCRSRS